MVKLIRGNLVNMKFPKYIFVLKKLLFLLFLLLLRRNYKVLLLPVLEELPVLIRRIAYYFSKMINTFNHPKRFFFFFEKISTLKFLAIKPLYCLIEIMLDFYFLRTFS